MCAVRSKGNRTHGAEMRCYNLGQLSIMKCSAMYDRLLIHDAVTMCGQTGSAV